MSERQEGSEQRNINTRGGTYIEGNVDTGGGDVVGRNQVKIGTVIGDIVLGNVDAHRIRREQENRRIMLQKVRRSWIDGVLARSLYRVARIDLGLEEQPDAIPHPWNAIVQEQGRPPRELLPGTRMGQVFDDFGCALLILGAPGTGKTTLLLELADELLHRADHDEGHKIPVVFNLSSWAVKRGPLSEWLADELNERYDVPRKTGRTWVEGDQILLLLDGLDEVAQEHREKCARAINAFRRDHGFIPLVVCCRIEEYNALATRLRLSGAILIQPMAREQVDGYLAQAGQPLAGVRAALQADEKLYELLDTPLMLNVAVLAYQGASAPAIQLVGTAKERRLHLFAAYVDAMFDRRGRKHPYVRDQTVRWLSWLAMQMAVHDQSIFYLEGIQPGWISKRIAKWIVWAGAVVLSVLVGGSIGLVFAVLFSDIYPSFWLLPGLGIGLINGIVAAMTGQVGRIRPVETLRWSAPVLLTRVAQTSLGVPLGLLIGAIVGIQRGTLLGPPAFGLLCTLVGALLGLVVRVLIGCLRGTQPVDMLRQLWTPMTKSILPVAASVGLGVWTGVAIGGLIISAGEIPDRTGMILDRLVNGLRLEQVGDLGLQSISGLVGMLIGSLPLGLTRGGISDRTLPNEGIRRSARRALVGGLLGLLFGGLTIGALAFVFGDLLSSVYVPEGVWGGVISLGSFSTVCVGFILGMITGGFACLQHIVLRLFLYCRDLTPGLRHYVPFLDYAAERLLLRKVGGGYIFVHRTLMEWFADRWEDQKKSAP